MKKFKTNKQTNKKHRNRKLFPFWLSLTSLFSFLVFFVRFDYYFFHIFVKTKQGKHTRSRKLFPLSIFLSFPQPINEMIKLSLQFSLLILLPFTSLLQVPNTKLVFNNIECNQAHKTHYGFNFFNWKLFAQIKLVFSTWDFASRVHTTRHSSQRIVIRLV